MSVNSSTVGNVSSINIEGMDVETLMMSVQSQRSQLLEHQLKDQIASVQAKNEKIGRMNELLGLLNKTAAGLPADAKAGDMVKIDSATSAEIKAAAKAAGITLPAEFENGWNVKLKDGTSIKVDEAGKREAETCKQKYWAFRSADYSGRKAVISIAETGINKGQLDGFIQQAKSQIDSLSNSQQMDMLRLQSLSNKRNEAFETMTNFMKKMQDARNSIIGNMR